jgi:hypothetical protein
MKSASLLAFALVMSWGCASAQQAPTSFGVAGMESLSGATTQTSSTVVIAPTQGCPVSMLASQAGATSLVKVQKGTPTQPETLSRPGQRINLILNGVSTDSKIKGATITARGLTARERLDRTSSGPGASDVRRTMDVSFTVGESGTLMAEITLPGFTAVKSIKLEALQFADGSTRDLAGAHLCTVTPDPVMLAGR